jgi:U5 small nuclear ribonucleoprotein component
MIRNVAIVGHLHHGKTTLVDMLVFETHKLVWDADKPVRAPQILLVNKSDRLVGRLGTPTLMSCLVNAIFPSSHLQCHLFYLQRLVNHI